MAVAIMFNTPYDPAVRFRNATGEIDCAMIAPSYHGEDAGLVHIYVARGASNFAVGQNVIYHNGDIVVSGPIKRIDDLEGQSFLVYVVPYTGPSFSSAVTGGTISLSSEAPADSDITSAPASAASKVMAAVTPAVKTYWPYILIAVVVTGAIIWKLKKGKK